MLAWLPLVGAFWPAHSASKAQKSGEKSKFEINNLKEKKLDFESQQPQGKESCENLEQK